MKEEEELTNRSRYLVLVIILSAASIICVISLDHQQLAYAKDNNNNEGENKTRITLDSGLPIPIDLPDSMLSKLRTFCENSSSNLTSLVTITCNAVMNLTQR
jgi:hypothetical protein